MSKWLGTADNRWNFKQEKEMEENDDTVIKMKVIELLKMKKSILIKLKTQYIGKIV